MQSDLYNLIIFKDFFDPCELWHLHTVAALPSLTEHLSLVLHLA